MRAKDFALMSWLGGYFGSLMPCICLSLLPPFKIWAVQISGFVGPRVRQAPWPIRRKGAVGGGHVSCWRCVPSLPLALEARDPEKPLCPIVARHPKYIPKLSWVMENKLSEDSALGGDTLGCWYLHERP
jgi:hypothetical protein